MGKIFIAFIVLLIAAYAMDAYVFRGKYRDEAIQQGRSFSYEVKRQFKNLGL